MGVEMNAAAKTEATYTLRHAGMTAWSEGLTLSEAAAEMESSAAPSGLICVRDHDGADCTLDACHEIAKRHT